MEIRTHFTYRIDIWDDTGHSIMEHVVGVEDFQVGEATYRAACDRWPNSVLTLRQGARVIHESKLPE